MIPNGCRRARAATRTALGAPVPPPGIDTSLEKDAEQVKVTSLRQRLELRHTCTLLGEQSRDRRHDVFGPDGLEGRQWRVAQQRICQWGICNGGDLFHGRPSVYHESLRQ